MDVRERQTNDLGPVSSQSTPCLLLALPLHKPSGRIFPLLLPLCAAEELHIGSHTCSRGRPVGLAAYPSYSTERLWAPPLDPGRGAKTDVTLDAD